MISSHATQLTEPGPYMPLNYFFAFPAQQITNTGGRDSTPQLRGLGMRLFRRGIKNNKGMANCAQHSSFITAHRAQPRQCILMMASFYPHQPGWEHQSIFMIDFWVLFWLEECAGGLGLPVLCVKCFYSHSVSQDWGWDWGVRQPIIREISVSTQTPGH